jgi:hypothetical protein
MMAKIAHTQPMPEFPWLPPGVSIPQIPGLPIPRILSPYRPATPLAPSLTGGATKEFTAIPNVSVPFRWEWYVNETNCTSLGTGSFSIIDPPKYGFLRFSAQLAAIPLGRPCEGMQLPVSIAYYTWTDTSAVGLRDVFKVEYATNDDRHSDTTIGVADEDSHPETGGSIQVQGPDAEGREKLLSWSWGTPDPIPTASLGLAKLALLASRMTDRQYKQRNLALIKAENFIKKCARDGGCANVRRSFQNPEYQGGRGEQRIDINVFRGIAFIPG